MSRRTKIRERSEQGASLPTRRADRSRPPDRKARRWAGPCFVPRASGLSRAATLMGVALSLDGPSRLIGHPHRQLGNPLVGIIRIPGEGLGLDSWAAAK